MYLYRMHSIKLENIRVYGYHGCLNEEAAIGSDYRVDLEVIADLSKSAVTDDLNDTVDYVSLNQIVVNEMATRSKLLEQVAQRILNKVLTTELLVTHATVLVSKINPPIGGDVQQVTISMSVTR